MKIVPAAKIGNTRMDERPKMNMRKHPMYNRTPTSIDHHGLLKAMRRNMPTKAVAGGTK